MDRVPWSTLIWPGLPQLWRHGSWSGLGQAVAFSTFLNLVLLATFGWTEWIAPGVRVAGWVVVGGWWLWAAYSAAREKRTAIDLKADTPDQYTTAQREYLKGNWYQAELVLVQMLHHEPHDTDARLMLATLLRHTGRRAEGIEQLRRLEKTTGSEKWHLEIQREWHRLTESTESEQLQHGAETQAEQRTNEDRVNGDQTTEQPPISTEPNQTVTNAA